MFSNGAFIIGLGNPGKRYAMTRHNLGELTVRAFADILGWQFKENKQFNALTVNGSIEGMPLHLLIPLTYMNASGYAVRRYLDYFKLNSTQVIVVCDDIALPFGGMRVRTLGSSGGHNGLKSIEAHMGTHHYLRLRMGVGAAPPQMDLADWVLSSFSADERQQLPDVINKGCDVLKTLLHSSVNDVMNTVNTKQLIRPQQRGQETNNEPKQT